MCRLILAKGRFSSARILDAAVAMSCGRTAEHDGPIRRHPNGWGAVWHDGGRIAIHRDQRPIEDGAARSPIAGLTTQFLAVHARHATLARNQGAEFTHPVQSTEPGPRWYLLHNGFLPTLYQRVGRPQSSFDSAEYLEYLVRDAGATLDLEATAGKLRELPPGGTSANAFLISATDAYIIHWTPADNLTPRYFTMYRVDAEHATIIASEIVPALAPRERWRPLPPQTISRISLTS